MQRRDALRTIAAGLVVPGIGTLTPDTALAAARAIHDRLGRARQDQPLLVLTEHQDALVTVLAELIIPETDTPGATAARVNRFVDVMLAEWFAAGEREGFLRDLDALDDRSDDTYGAPFLELDQARQTALLRELDAEVSAPSQADADFFRRMKWLTLYGYYTSEVGATQEAGLAIVPGRYDGCAPVRAAARGGAR